jgi:hypothetical protein
MVAKPLALGLTSITTLFLSYLNTRRSIALLSENIGCSIDAISSLNVSAISQIKKLVCLFRYGSNLFILSAYQKHTIPSKSLTIPSKSLTGINVQVINIKAYSNNLITLTIFNLI